MTSQPPPSRPDSDGSPTGHLAWAFSGLPELESRSTRFLAAGAARGEKLLYVVDEPRPILWPAALLASGQLEVATVHDVYGPDTWVDPHAQRAVFSEALTDALRAGYTGLRVVADNTSATLGARLGSWLAWEQVADRFMAENPVTGLCTFDRTRLRRGVLQQLMGVHVHRLDGRGRAPSRG